MYRKKFEILGYPLLDFSGITTGDAQNGNHSHAKHWTPFVCLLIYSHLKFRCWVYQNYEALGAWTVSRCKKKKVKWSRYRPGVAQRVGMGIALLFHDRSPRRGWVVSSTPLLHFTPGKDLVCILQEAGWSPGPVWMGGKSRPHQDSILDHPACSQSLYRLSYPGHPRCPKGSRKLRYPDYMTVAHDGDKVIKGIMFW